NSSPTAGWLPEGPARSQQRKQPGNGSSRHGTFRQKRSTIRPASAGARSMYFTGRLPFFGAGRSLRVQFHLRRSSELAGAGQQPSLALVDVTALGTEAFHKP